MLVLLVILITLGVWYYLPPSVATTVVYYQAGNADSPDTVSAAAQTEDAWQVALQSITFLDARVLPWLSSSAGPTKVDLTVRAVNSTWDIPPKQLDMILIDDQGGNAFAKADRQSSGDGIWKYEAKFSAIAENVTSLSLIVNAGDISCQFLHLPLP
jgi:hypothetical protein